MSTPKKIAFQPSNYTDFKRTLKAGFPLMPLHRPMT